MININNLKLESISIKDLKAFQKVQRMISGETETRRNMGIISDHTIDYFKNLLFNCERLNEEKYVVGLAHEKTGSGYVTFKFDCDYYKRITLTILHKNYEGSYITFRVRDQIGKVPLTTNVDKLQNLINEFVKM